MGMTVDTLRVTGVAKIGQLELGGNGLDRAYIAQDDDAIFPVDLGSLKIWDSGQPLTATPNTDDLGLIAGTFGTANLYVSAGDCKNATVTRRARFQVRLPDNYVAGQTVKLRLAAGVLTTLPTSTCTADAEAYLVGRDTNKSGSDLVTTSAQSIKSLTFADKDFTIDATNLEAGDVLDIRITIDSIDSATPTAVTPAIAAIDLLADVKG